MSKKKNPKPKTWVEVFQAERKEFPKGYCITRVIPDKRFKKPKYRKGLEEYV
jgi:hypothetical protein